jgi:NAD+ synthase
MPDRDSSSESLRLGKLLAHSLRVEAVTEDITPILESTGCYRRQAEAIQKIFEEYGDGWKSKIVLPSILVGDRLNISSLTVETPAGERMTKRLPREAYLQLVAATNFKQRVRADVAYYHADRLNYAVCGTPNRLEYDQGFFVKGGDGSADFKPIAHLYKSQVYAIAESLGIPEEIRRRCPTTDTFTLPQTQEEFYFSLPYDKMDLCLYAHNHGISASEAALVLGLTTHQVERVYWDIAAKRRATLPLHLPPLLAGSVPEVSNMVRDALQTKTE